MAKLTCNFISYTLRRTVDITVVIPSATIPESMSTMMGGEALDLSYKNKEKFPVLYLLHGMGNNHATWTGYTNVELFAEERNIAVVMISAENKCYVNVSEGDKFFDFIENELQDFVCGTFPISDKASDTFIAGLSMGGFGTLVHGLSHPEKYAAMGAFSAAVELNPAALSGGEDKGILPEYDPKTLAHELVAKGEKLPMMYIACGEKDFLFEANTAFKNQLIDSGIDVTWVTMPEYGHEWRFWNIQVEKFLDWLPRTDFYGNKGKRQI